MSDYSWPKSHNKYSYVFKTREGLNKIETQKRAKSVSDMRKKWVATAIIALASGSTVFLSQTSSVEAATGETSVQNVKVSVAKNESDSQKFNNSQNFEQKTPQAAAANQNGSQVQNDHTETQLQNQQTTQSQVTQAHTEENNASSIPESANQADHVKGNIQSAWDQGYKGENTVVAVIDSGADTSHKDFQTMPSNPKLKQEDVQSKIDQQGYGKYVNEKFPYVYNYADRDNDYIKSDDNNQNDSPHGQHVSGIIAADGHPEGDQQYVVGVAPEAQLMQLRVFGQFSDEKTDDVARAIYDATNLGADVVQMSLGQGVADQQLTNIEQKAVQYAIDHGVFVSISASNNGNSASVDNPSKVTAKGYVSGSEAGNYEPLNSGTVANPGASKNALTVAAETSGTGKDSDMASFSSWGPLSDFSLKPDLSAPGYQVVSTVNDNQYQTMSGTSMAGPFAAGSAALVIQRLKKTNPELKGAELVAATKALLMNSAKVQTQNGYTAPVSPRRQGAGQIDVGAATANPVYVTAADGTSSLSLRQVDEKTTFTLTFHNLTDQEQNYSFNDLGGGYTEQRDPDSGVFHEVQLAGAHVNGVGNFTLAPKEVKDLQYTLDLQGLNKNQPVEGWLHFTNDKDKSTVVVPYLAYYGDLTSENVFDQNANEEKPDIQGNRFVNENNYPLGVTDQESLKQLVNVDSDYNWQEVAKLYESGKVAFSPNDDHQSDLIKPYAYLKQNVKDLKVEILDAKGNVVRVVSDVQGVDKSYDESGVTKDASLSVSMRDNPDAFEWDGKVYDTKTGQMVTAPDGQYTYRFVATLWNEGPNQKQTADFPVVVDTQAPSLSVKYDSATHTLSGNYEDKGAGFTDYSYATVQVNDKVFGYKLNEGESGFDNSEKTKGHFNFTLSSDALAALSGSLNKVSVTLSDVANNTTVKTVDVPAVKDQPAVSVWNATEGVEFNKNSKDYNKENDTYTLYGSAAQDFYLNGALVQVRDGKYEVPVKTTTQDLVFSTDQAGKNVLKSFTTFTPKAFFNWQNVDGFDGNFGVNIYSVKTNDPNNAVVQAAVPLGKNVKAYAQDYFTGEVYKGQVENGVATFHMHTSINQGEDGIFKRALLTGWSEVDGPAYNDKQVTSKAGVASSNHLGVYYTTDKVNRKVYTDRADLGVDVQDEAADLSSFGPTAYPGHALADLTARTDPNPAIHFDYLNDNDTTRFGQNAVTDGYYDSVTKKFTVTGHVDPEVKSLTVLGDSSDENAPQNQVKLGKDGKFSFSFTTENVGQRPVAYIYTDQNGQKVRGTLNVVLDTVAPTLNVDQVNGNELEVKTNNPLFKLSGVVNDNLDGYRLYVNGNNIYREFLNSGYNKLAGLNTDGTDVNPYGPHNFEESFNLNDDNNQPTTHVFTIYVVDQVGNKVEKKIAVNYDPNYVAEPPKTDQDQNSGQTAQPQTNPAVNVDKPVHVDKPATPDNTSEVPAVDQTKHSDSEQTNQVPKDTTDQNSGQVPAVPVSRETSVTKDNNLNDVVLTAKSFPLLHDAYLYDENGEVVLTSDPQKKSVLKKGKTISSLQNGHVYVIKGVKFYQVGKNQYVKVANTVLQGPKRLQLKHNAFVYDEKGKLVKKHGKSVLLPKNKWVSALNNADKFKVNGVTYYKLADHQYIKVANTVVQPAKKLKLTHNAFVYDQNGKRVKKSKLLKEGTVLSALNGAEKFKLKNKTYYQVGKNQYVKVANTL